MDIVFIKTYGSHLSEKNLLLNKSLTTLWTNAVKVVKGDETVGHLSRKFSQITQYFLARSGEIGFEVIGHKQCGGLEVQCQLQFNCTNKSTNETLERTTGEQDLGLELS